MPSEAGLGIHLTFDLAGPLVLDLTWSGRQEDYRLTRPVK